MIRRLTYLMLAALPILGMGCREHVADSPLPNATPVTYLWLFPEESVGTGVSRQRLHWWGEDADGIVRGYLFAVHLAPTVGVGAVWDAAAADSLRYSWTSKNDTTYLFPLDTLFRKFEVVIRGVDNSFAGLRDGTPVRLRPFPFADANDNGAFDPGEVRLDGLTSALDPLGAHLTFPVRNSPPVITFLPNPIDPTIALRQPDTTFTAATFAFKGSDPDGNGTLVSYRIALNDTSSASSWLTLTTRDTIITLVVPRSVSDAAGAVVPADVYSGSFLGRRKLGEQLPGLRLDALNTLYVQVRDVAGEYSPAIKLPAAADTWYVRRPRGKLLVVSDYTTADAQAALVTYLTSLASIPGGNYATVDRIDLARGLNVTDKVAGRLSTNVPPYVDPALIHTFLLYDYILWYTDQVPTLSVAQLSLFTYLQNGGKVIFSTTFLNTADPRGALRDFAPIDSVSSVDLSPSRPLPPPPVAGDTRLPANFQLLPDSSTPGTIYPRLALNASPANHVLFMRPIYRRTDARYLYHLQPDTRDRYTGMPQIAVVDGARTIVFVGLPLHLMNNTDPAIGNARGVSAFLEQVMLHEFNPLQRVNRMVF